MTSGGAAWIVTAGWDGLLCAIFAIFAGMMLCTCGIAWVLWAVIRAFRRKRGAIQ